MPYRHILHNRIQCNHCGEVIESRYRHDFVSCRCGTCCVDGGTDYLRRGFLYSRADFTELSETADTAKDAAALSETCNKAD